MPARPKVTAELRKQILALVRSGLHPERAFVAVELGASTFREWVARARDPNAKGKRAGLARDFVDAIEVAIAKSEADAVLTTHRAATVDSQKTLCPECGEAIKLDAATLLAMSAGLGAAQSLKALAASAAFHRLSLRFPKRWSPRVTLSVEEEHDRLLDVARRVLAPEVLELLLEAYLASFESESAAAGDPPGPGSGRVH